MKVLVYTIESGTLRISENDKEKIHKKVEESNHNVVFEDEHENALQQIDDADILFGYITPQMLERARRLKWIQAPMSSFGTPRGNYYIFPELAESDVLLTSMSGIYSDIIPTHVFAFITSLAREFPKLIQRQAQRVWDSNVQTMNLRGKTLGIVGLGGIGKRVAYIGNAFGMRVIAVDPTPQNVPGFIESIRGPENLEKFLVESDFVVLCLPDAPGTVNIIGTSELKSMKETAYLINIGRGRNVDLEALTLALTRGEIAGAGLDVFPPGYEPLPPDHPLWTMEHVIITPHCAGLGTPSERKIEVFLENFDRFIGGRELLNLVDKGSMILEGPGYNLP